MLSIFAALAAAAPAAPAAAIIPPPAKLRQAIAARDAELFDLFFLGCDPARMRAMLADDVEFYHDKGGYLFRNATEMVADYTSSCTARAKPDTWRSRRELVASSLTVDPVPGYGAMEAGEHLFFERKGDGPEKLVGRARFAMVWKLEGQTWKMSRILSFDHHPATAP